MAKSTNLSEYIKDITKCAICLEYYDDPRSPPCLHTFCLKCIRVHCRDKCPDDDVNCPVCRKEFKLPAEGVEGLQFNFFVADLVSVRKNSASNSAAEVHSHLCDCCGDETKRRATVFCMDCREKFCDQCSLRCVKRKGKSHKVVKLGDELEPELVRCRDKYCEHHTDELVKMYCDQCQTNICTVCFALKHTGHKCLEIKEVASEFSKQILDKIAMLSSKQADINRERTVLNSTRKKFLTMVRKTEVSIKEKCEELKRQIDTWGTELLQQVETVKNETEKEIKTRDENIELALVALESFINYSQEVLDKGTSCDITRVANDLKTRATELQKDAIDQYQAPVVSFTAAPSLKNEQSWLGEISVVKQSDQPRETSSRSRGTTMVDTLTQPVASQSHVDKSKLEELAACQETLVENGIVMLHCPTLRACIYCGTLVKVDNSCPCVKTCPSCRCRFCVLCLRPSTDPGHIRLPFGQFTCTNALAGRQTSLVTQ